MSTSTRPPVNDPASVRLIGVYLGALFFVLGVSLLLLLKADKDTPLYIFKYQLTMDQSLALAVLASGAMGGLVHVATSFSDYVGNRRYHATWQWWYLLRPGIGGALALVFYFLIRGGILSLTGSTTDTPNIYGMTAIAALVGMFSKQATDKLDDVFDTLFNSEKDAARKDGLVNPQPRLDAVDPLSVAAGAPETSLLLNGAGFTADSVVRFAGTDRAPQFVSATQLRLKLSVDDLKNPGQAAVQVHNPAPGGGDSAVLTFVVSDRRVAPAGTPDDRGATPAGATSGTGATSPATDAAAPIPVPATAPSGNASTMPAAGASSPAGSTDAATGATPDASASVVAVPVDAGAAATVTADATQPAAAPAGAPQS